MACAFCAVVAGEAPADLVLEDPEVVAFLDVKPVFPGHVLVVPRAHHTTLPDLPVALLGAVFGVAREVAAAVVPGLGAEGSFVAVNSTVSQSVPHLHVHVVPRRRGDGLKGFFWPRHGYSGPAEVEEVAGRLRRALAAGRDGPG